MSTPHNPTPASVLVTGATGKIGSRVLARLDQTGVTTRSGSRTATPLFDWNQPDSWPAALAGINAVFVSYYPDLSFPGATATLGAFAAAAKQAGAERLVLISGRGEPAAADSETAVCAGGVPTTILRCSWFAQNFSENYWTDSVVEGVIALPVGSVTEPFVDADDIADVAVVALLQPGHEGRTYELTGPASISFAEAAAALAAALGRPIVFASVTVDDFVEGAVAAGLTHDEAHGIAELFSTVLDGRNSATSADIELILGRPAGSFATYARRTAATGVWDRTPGAGS